jgi:hyperosmotically inducible protein
MPFEIAKVVAIHRFVKSEHRLSAKNGTLVLKGSVKTAAQKREAGELAKHVPNVEQVVNEIQIKPDKHSTDHS